MDGSASHPQAEREAAPARSGWAARAPWLAWGVFGLTGAVTITALVMLVYSRDVPAPEAFGFRGNALPTAAVFAAVAAIVATFRPSNPVGWLLLTEGFLASLVGLVFELAVFALVARPGSIPGGALFAWLDSWLWVPVLGLPSVIFLLVPNGRLPSPGWRPGLWVAVGCIVLSVVGVAMTPAFIGFPPVADTSDLRAFVALPLLPLPAVVAAVPVVAALAISVVSLVVRYRRAARLERLQIKWLAYAAALTVAVLAVNQVEIFIRGGYASDRVTDPLVIVAALGLPVAIAFSVLRYRLYDIDFLICRTLVYGPLTATLAGAYTGAILFFRLVFVDLLGLGSDAAVATTAVLVAALFIPLRNLLQSLVDRFFKEDDYRRLSKFSEEAARVAELTSQETVARRFLALATSATGATGGRIVLNDTGRGPAVFMDGAETGQVRATVPLTFNGAEVGQLELGPPRDGEGYRQHHLEVLESAARSVAQALYRRAA